MESTSNSNI